VVSSDEKTSIQARVRCHKTVGPAPGRGTRAEFCYDRAGVLQYLATWDVHPTGEVGLRPTWRVLGVAASRRPASPWKRFAAAPSAERVSKALWRTDGCCGSAGSVLAALTGWQLCRVLVVPGRLRP
jgi:hypothetical protein